MPWGDFNSAVPVAGGEKDHRLQPFQPRHFLYGAYMQQRKQSLAKNGTLITQKTKIIKLDQSMMSPLLAVLPEESGCSQANWPELQFPWMDPCKYSLV